MSNIAMQGGATGTGTVTLLAPVTSTNRTLTLPDATGTMATAESTLAQFNATGAAPVYACRAWCKFNGTLTGTNAPTAGGNVTSVTRNGTGDYTVNFTTAMPDANYLACPMPGSGGTITGVIGTTSQTTSAYRMTYSNTSGGNSDSSFAGVSIFR